MNTEPVQSILVPVTDGIPKAAIDYAKLLSGAYDKPISILCMNTTLEAEVPSLGFHYTLASKNLNIALATINKRQDCVMVVWQNSHKWRHIQQQLNACRELRIPYFFISESQGTKIPKKVSFPVSFLIEDREKATWGRSLHRQFLSHFTILKPKDKGSRAAKNVAHIETFFSKHQIPFTIIQGRKSSFKIDQEAMSLLSEQSDLILLTASRDYGLDDQFFGPKELHIIRKNNTPLMLLNPRSDLYVLCGD